MNFMTIELNIVCAVCNEPLEASCVTPDQAVLAILPCGQCGIKRTAVQRAAERLMRAIREEPAVLPSPLTPPPAP